MISGSKDMASLPKRETRILALDDGKLDERTIIVGLVFRGAEFIDGMISFFVKKDGNDATEKLVSSVKNSRHRDQINAIMMKGITVAGFNCFDIHEISMALGKPVVAVMRKRPGTEFYRAAEKFGHVRDCYERAGEIKHVGSVYVQKAGCSWEYATELVKMTTVRGNIPEPIRVAHIIASGLSGDSSGRA